MTVSHHRQNFAIRKQERKRHKHLKWALEVADENDGCRRAHYKAGKEVKMEQGDATFVICRDWARFGDAVGPPAH